MEAGTTTRRERLRLQTLREIKALGLEQIREGGPSALSLNAVARSMGMSGPAIYRYFASRDDLLAELVVDVYDDLGAALEAAVQDGRRRAPARRLRALAAAYRAWALAHPHEYRLAFSTESGSGRLRPERTIPAAHRGMLAVLGLAEAVVPEHAPRVHPALAAQLRAWAASRPGAAEPPVAALLFAIQVWTRLHGLASIEIEGTFSAMGIDPTALYDAELDRLLGAS